MPRSALSAPPRLDRVAERGPRAVRLEAWNARRRRCGIDPHSLDQPPLRRAVRRRQARARPVLLDRRPENRRLAAARRSHQKRPAPLAPAVAVRPQIERVAPTAGRRHPRRRRRDVRRFAQHFGADREPVVALVADPQRQDARVQRRQRRRARRVDRVARPDESEAVRQPPGRHRQRAAARREHGRLISARQPARFHADEDADARVRERVSSRRRGRRGLEAVAAPQRVVPDAQHEALLRIHGPRLRGGNSKSRAVEAELVLARERSVRRRGAGATPRTRPPRGGDACVRDQREPSELARRRARARSPRRRKATRDDGDRASRRRRRARGRSVPGRRSRRAIVASDLLREEARDRLERGMVEQRGRREIRAQSRGERAHELRRRDRVQARGHERSLHLDHGAHDVARDGSDLVAGVDQTTRRQAVTGRSRAVARASGRG